MISRTLSLIYDRALDETGLSIAQFNALTALLRMGGLTASKLGALLLIEKSTLSRNLDHMLEAGWVARESYRAPVMVTGKGEKLYARAVPHWRKAQAEAGKLLGGSGAAALIKVGTGLFGSIKGKTHA
ncbi:hypothetical protein PLCT2_01878 [Planctomycetaceae bacterium]|nr:hypothetical protein PLCT2_01878 [Planctomycetaceae bacterium]